MVLNNNNACSTSEPQLDFLTSVYLFLAFSLIRTAGRAFKIFSFILIDISVVARTVRTSQLASTSFNVSWLIL